MSISSFVVITMAL